MVACCEPALVPVFFPLECLGGAWLLASCVPYDVYDSLHDGQPASIHDRTACRGQRVARPSLMGGGIVLFAVHAKMDRSETRMSLATSLAVNRAGGSMVGGFVVMSIAPKKRRPAPLHMQRSGPSCESDRLGAGLSVAARRAIYRGVIGDCVAESCAV